MLTKAQDGKSGRSPLSKSAFVKQMDRSIRTGPFFRRVVLVRHNGERRTMLTLGKTYLFSRL